MLAKQEALTAMAGVAVVAGHDEFGKYYDYIMPITLATCQVSISSGQSRDESQSLFRGK